VKIDAGKRVKIIKNPRVLHNVYLQKICPKNTISCGLRLDQTKHIVSIAFRLALCMKQASGPFAVI
jgi:hypothetical protein